MYADANGRLGQYRDLLVAVESKELNKSHHLEIAQRELAQMEQVNRQLQDAQRRLREYEYREFEMEEARHELEILQHERDALQMRVHRQHNEMERAKRAYADKISELEAQLHHAGDQPASQQGNGPSLDTQALIQQAIADSQAKLAQLRRKHTALMEKYTDLEMEYDSVKAQLDAMSTRDGHGFGDDDTRVNSAQDRFTDAMSGALGHSADSAYDTASDHNPTALSENAYIVSASDPTHRRFGAALPMSPPRSDGGTVRGSAGFSYRSSRQDSIASRGSSQPPITYNQTAPITADEIVKVKSGASEGSEGSSLARKREKVQPDSKVRVYGRGKIPSPFIPSAGY
jgi:hypothetical protein